MTMIDQPPRVKMNDLPEPVESDLLPSGTRPRDWWSCRYCEKGESGLGITAEAEQRRAFAHAVLCPSRPENDIPDISEIRAFRELCLPVCQRKVIELETQRRLLQGRFAVLRSFPKRRKVFVQIEQLAEAQHDAALRVCFVADGIEWRRTGAEERAPIYGILPHDPLESPDSDQKYMIVRYDGETTRTICQRMDLQHAVWLIRLIRNN